MKWITRERAEDRPHRLPVAGGAVHRSGAEFLYVRSSDVLSVADETEAIPTTFRCRIDARRELCSFDAFLKKYRLDDPALQRLALIVRGADTSRLELTPQSAGLYALSLGLSHDFADDHEMLKHGMVMYDALYAWCKHCQGESHNWPPR